MCQRTLNAFSVFSVLCVEGNISTIHSLTFDVNIRDIFLSLSSTDWSMRTQTLLLFLCCTIVTLITATVALQGFGGQVIVLKIRREMLPQNESHFLRRIC